MDNSAFAFYTEKHRKYLIELKSVSQKIRRFAWFRFFSFLLIFAPVFVFGVKSWTTLVLTLSVIVVFFFLIKKNVQLEKKKNKFIELKKLVEDELLALKHSFSHFQNGKEFLDIDHFFSYDLDLFGEGSLFQFLNRTSTIGGRQKLAAWLMKPSVQKEIIEKKQNAIQELTEIPDWRLNFLANGNLFKETEELNHEIKAWSQLDLKLKRASKVKWMIRFVPLITVISAIPAIMGISNLFITLTVLLQWFMMYFFWQKITQYFGYFGRKSELLSKYMQLLRFVEEHKFQTDYLVELQKKVQKPESASKVFKQLKSLVKELEYRQIGRASCRERV